METTTTTNETINRKETIKDFTVTIRSLKNEIKEMQRKQGYVSWSDYNKLSKLREEARYLNIIHTLLKKKVDLDKEFSSVMEDIKSIGIETHWYEGNEPNEDVFKKYVQKYEPNDSRVHR